MRTVTVGNRVVVLMSCAAIGFGFIGLSPQASAAEPERSYSIAEPGSGSALRAFAMASGQDVIFDPELVKGKTTQGLHGQLADEEALARILAGSGLTFERMANGGFVVHPIKPTPDSAHAAASDLVVASTNNVYALDEVVVTGTAESIDKFTAPYAVSTLKQEAILDKAPRSLVDLLRGQPGLTVENSGGEGGDENIVIRGLPYAGFRLVDVLEDGIPLFESNYERFLNIDEIFRVDLMTEHAEVERGGTASIFSNNASGGVVNLITRHGTETQEGAIDLEGGSASLFRVSAYQSGPITDNLLYSIGGSYRVDDGLRDETSLQVTRAARFSWAGRTSCLTARSSLT